ncbi:MAG: hypothetical protein GVY07_02965 [Bacteroidetes bacterium]|jgi:hypothetical protein|nr:hypothetical protein [Bacteroidota bacterium]
MICQTHKSILILILLFWIIQPLQGQEADLVVIGAALIDGTGTPPQDSTTILVQNGKIATVNSGSQADVPDDARVIHANGKYIMPGLIDLHVHYDLSGWIESIPGIFGIDVSDRYPYEDVYENLKTNPDRFHRSYLCSGVTTVFEPGSFPWTYQIEQNSIETKNAPRYVTAGPILTSLETIISHPFGDGMSVYMEDEEAVRNAVRMLNLNENRWVKVYRPDLITDRSCHLNLLDAISEEAQKAELSLISNTNNEIEFHRTQNEPRRI